MSFCYGFVRYKTDNGQKLEPIEEVTIEVIIQFDVHSMLVHVFGLLTS
jgi:predicted membrane GTPase involved in stress response